MLASPDTQLAPVHPGARPTPRRSSPRSPSSRPTSSATRRSPSPRSRPIPAALQAAISEGAPVVTQGPGQLPPPAPVPDRVRRAVPPAQPGRPPASPRDPDAERRDHDRHPGPQPDPVDEPQAARRLGPAQEARPAAVDQDQPPAAQGDLRQATPLAKWVAPAQTVCNYWNYCWTLLAEHLSERDQVGFSQRVAIVGGTVGPTETQLRAGRASPGTRAFRPTARPGRPAIRRQRPAAERVRRRIRPADPARQLLRADGPAGFGQYPDCQAGQTGYPLGNCPVPGQAPIEPGERAARTSRAPAASPTSSGTRTASACCKDTRIPSHQP